MDIVIAPDSFKGSMTATQAASAMQRGVADIIPAANTVIKPMADGGEGTLDTLLTSAGGQRISISCTGPLGDKQETYYGMLKDGTAVIECANIVGLTQVPESRRNPDDTTTYGIGEVMIDALNQGCESVMLGLGGSATNDGGMGMLQALGMKTYDQTGKELGPFGKDLLSIADVDLENLDPRLADLSIQVASDVDNPLCGDNGATLVYGPQKGAGPQQIKRYDQALKTYSHLIESKVGQSFNDTLGAGAAGGLGFALLTIGAELVSGATLIADESNLDAAIKRADLVLTGEGQSDEQTLYGKAPGYVAELGVSAHVPVVLLSGSLSGDMEQLRQQFAGCFAITNQPMSLNACMENAETLLEEQVKQVVHFWYDTISKQ